MRAGRLLPLFLLALPVLAQDWDLPPDEVADLVDRYVERGEESLRDGNYDEARLRFQKALKRDAKRKEAYLGLATAHRMVGAYEKAGAALDRLLEHHPNDRLARVEKARLDLRHGRTAAVREGLAPILQEGPEGVDLAALDARNLVAASLARDGRRDDARTTLDPMLQYFERRIEFLANAAMQSQDLRRKPAVARPIAREMVLLARAIRMYVELSPLDHDMLAQAVKLVGRDAAQALDPDNWEVWEEYVRVTRKERERAIARARKALALATDRNPELADLYTEVAKSVMTGLGAAEAGELVKKALRVDPKQTDAHAIAARIALEDNEYGKADDHMTRGLAVDGRHRDLLALRATLELLRGNEEAFEKGMQEVLAIDPTYGHAFHLAGLVVATRQRRYDTGVALVKRGLEIDPTDFQAHATLGIFLANLGRAEEAAATLKKSEELFPFSHPMRRNFKTVLDYVLTTMTEQKTENFVIRYDPSEYEIMHRFLPERLEADWADMTKRYGFTPTRPILVEVFRKADDFSVRTIGLPGIPALGACFGGLITLDSPQALPPGSFLWASTARHEFAHVMSLQMSGGQVPRWFTEGLSVLEEQPLDTGWGREAPFERQVFDAWQTGTLPEIQRFDGMFRSSRVVFAYYVGGLMLQFLEQRSGEQGIVKALELWGEDRPMDEVFRAAFEIGLDEFNEQFAAFIGERVKRYRITPDFRLVARDLRRKLLDEPDDGEARIRLAWAYYQSRKFIDAGAALDLARKQLAQDHALVRLLDAHLTLRRGEADGAKAKYEAFFAGGGEDYRARMQVAAMAQRAGDTPTAIAHLEAAKAAWPVAVTGTNPYSVLRRLYETRGEENKALQTLEEHAAIASKDVPMRLELARRYRLAGRTDDAIRALEEALRVTVFDRRVHAGLLPLYRDKARWKDAIRAAHCVVALRTEEDDGAAVASMWCDLADVLFRGGRAEEAKAALFQAKKLGEDAVLPRIRELEEKLGQ